jgi:hypothetical protein
MSGGPRRRVTFADLVSARLPSPAPTDAETQSEDRPPDEPSAPAEAQPETAEKVASEAAAAPPETVAGEELKTASSRSPGDWQSSHGSQSPRVRRSPDDRGGSQNDCQPAGDWQPPHDSQSYGDRQPLKEVKGYLRLSNTVVDSLLPTLDVYEQAAFIQLYRLSHGFGNYTCKVSLPALQARTGLKPTSMKQAISKLQARGIVEKLAAEIGFGREQGITYWVSPDGRQTYGDWQSSRGWQSPGDTIKEKGFKETILKGRLTPEEIKTCPDCHGVGMWYPEGPGKGVARCLHPSLRAKR